MKKLIILNFCIIFQHNHAMNMDTTIECGDIANKDSIMDDETSQKASISKRLSDLPRDQLLTVANLALGEHGSLKIPFKALFIKSLKDVPTELLKSPTLCEIPSKHEHINAIFNAAISEELQKIK